MNNQTQTMEQQVSQVQGFISDIRAFKKGEWITLVLPGNQRIRKHENYFKSILGIPFERKVRKTTEPRS